MTHTQAESKKFRKNLTSLALGATVVVTSTFWASVIPAVNAKTFIFSRQTLWFLIISDFDLP